MKNKVHKARILVKGRNSAKVVNALCKKNVRIYDLYVQESEFSFCIAKKDIEKTFAILKKLCYTYSVKDYVNAKIAIKTIVKKAPLLLGFALSIFFISIFSTTYLGIRTDGTKEQELTVISILEQNGVKMGSSMNEINVDELCLRIIKACNVAECTVKKQGNYLQITFLPTQSLVDKTVTYDGSVYSIEATNLPAGVSVTYENNGKTEAGEYIERHYWHNIKTGESFFHL